MKNNSYTDLELDTWVRGMADNSQLTYDQNAWNKLNQRLNAAPVPPASKNITRFFTPSLNTILLIVGIGIGTSLIYLSTTPAPEIINPSLPVQAPAPKIRNLINKPVKKHQPVLIPATKLPTNSSPFNQKENAAVLATERDTTLLFDSLDLPKNTSVKKDSTEKTLYMIW